MKRWLCILFLLLYLMPVRALAAFSATNVISDSEFLNSKPMSAADINNFLASKGSWLANYTIPENIKVQYPVTDGSSVSLTEVDVRQFYNYNGANFYGKTVAQLIYDEATEHNINPRVVLTTLQKESSAITSGSPSSKTTETWPMFYYYDETMASCLSGNISVCDNDRYRQRAIDFGGVGQQIAYATAYFKVKYDAYNSGSYKGQKYSDPINIDGQTLSCETIGTRVLYLYTPHISANFYNIYSGWWWEPNTGNAVNQPALSSDSTSGDVLQDDTSKVSYSSYNGSYKVSGSKANAHKVYLGGELIANTGTTSWEYTFNPPEGATTYTIEYKNIGEAQVATKIVEVNKHKNGDINGDSKVDLLDLSLVADKWESQNPDNPLIDINADGQVDLLDLSIIASNWSE